MRVNEFMSAWLCRKKRVVQLEFPVDCSIVALIVKYRCCSSGIIQVPALVAYCGARIGFRPLWLLINWCSINGRLGSIDSDSDLIRLRHWDDAILLIRVVRLTESKYSLTNLWNKWIHFLLNFFLFPIFLVAFSPYFIDMCNYIYMHARWSLRRRIIRVHYRLYGCQTTEPFIHE